MLKIRLSLTFVTSYSAQLKHVYSPIIHFIVVFLLYTVLGLVRHLYQPKVLYEARLQ